MSDTQLVIARLTVDHLEIDARSEKATLMAKFSSEPNDNPYATSTPDAELKITVTNHELFGYFRPGDQFYISFDRIPK